MPLVRFGGLQRLYEAKVQKLSQGADIPDQTLSREIKAYSPTQIMSVSNWWANQRTKEKAIAFKVLPKWKCRATTLKSSGDRVLSYELF